jgi:hypothetical protein
MHLELGSAAAMLASPSVALEDLSAKMVVGFRFEPQARPLLP